jgi:putative ABC transport system substrate-binding protein
MRLIGLAVILAVGVTLAPLAGEAQQHGRTPHIGVLSGTPGNPHSEGLRQGLRELGYTEGQNIVIEWRWTEGKAERVSELASELVRLKPDLIVTMMPQPAFAVKAETTTIPLVFLGVGDPVGVGLVASLAKPGGNITGLATFVPGGFTTKGAELLREAVPRLSRLAVLMNPTNTMHQRVLSTELAPAIGQLQMVILPVEARTAQELDSAFETAARTRADAIWVFGDALTFALRVRIAQLAARYRLPDLYIVRENVEAGGFMSYGPSTRDLGRRAATYVDKILKGAKPADLPVEQPTKFELVINLKTAKALGLTIPQTLLLRADQIIE